MLVWQESDESRMNLVLRTLPWKKPTKGFIFRVTKEKTYRGENFPGKVACYINFHWVFLAVYMFLSMLKLTFKANLNSVFLIFAWVFSLNSSRTGLLLKDIMIFDRLQSEEQYTVGIVSGQPCPEVEIHTKKLQKMGGGGCTTWFIFIPRVLASMSEICSSRRTNH